VDMDMDMDVIFHIHGNPGLTPHIRLIILISG